MRAFSDAIHAAGKDISYQTLPSSGVSPFWKLSLVHFSVLRNTKLKKKLSCSHPRLHFKPLEKKFGFTRGIWSDLFSARYSFQTGWVKVCQGRSRLDVWGCDLDEKGRFSVFEQGSSVPKIGLILLWGAHPNYWHLLTKYELEKWPGKKVIFGPTFHSAVSQLSFQNWDEWARKSTIPKKVIRERPLDEANLSIVSRFFAGCSLSLFLLLRVFLPNPAKKVMSTNQVTPPAIYPMCSSVSWRFRKSTADRRMNGWVIRGWAEGCRERGWLIYFSTLA